MGETVATIEIERRTGMDPGMEGGCRVSLFHDRRSCPCDVAPITNIATVFSLPRSTLQNMVSRGSGLVFVLCTEILYIKAVAESEGGRCHVNQSFCQRV